MKLNKKPEITLKKENITPYYELISKYTKDSDIFKMTRDIQDDGRKNDLEVINLGKVYLWLKDYRNKQKVA